ncbi:PREDICTED: uncharacterized protein LOC106149125 [Chinchilla lanigera]|uniref:uncharacterized protein LOC106149125 n=1 Tax=Chinchilla lanigera TaxID=34839 RepID=UPI000697D542|nr:PREDICTED: uncharacterized protein LOC106149125 [Chinchilla lanigera]
MLPESAFSDACSQRPSGPGKTLSTPQLDTPRLQASTTQRSSKERQLHAPVSSVHGKAVLRGRIAGCDLWRDGTALSTPHACFPGAQRGTGGPGSLRLEAEASPGLRGLVAPVALAVCPWLWGSPREETLVPGVQPQACWPQSASATFNFNSWKVRLRSEIQGKLLHALLLCGPGVTVGEQQASASGRSSVLSTQSLGAWWGLWNSDLPLSVSTYFETEV